MSGLKMYRKVVYEDSDTFERQWAQKKKQYADSEANLPAASSSGALASATGCSGQAASSSVDSEKGKGKGKTAASGKDKGKSKGTSSPRGAKRKTESGDTDDRASDTLKKAELVKKVYNQTVVQAMNLATKIASKDSRYAWANNEQNLGQLTSQLAVLQTSVGEIASEFLVQTTMAMKKRHTSARLEAELAQFVTLQDKIDALGATVKTILSRANC